MNEFLVIREGSWGHSSRYLKSFVRNGNIPDYRYFHLGFRVVQDAENRVLKGGSWGPIVGLLDCAWTEYYTAYNDSGGFRVVCDE